jgi:CRISPR-associated endonuclease/helicase Cas3
MEDDAESLVEELQEALADWSGSLEGTRWKWLKTVAAHLANDNKLARHITTHPNGGLVLASSRPLPEGPPDGVRFNDEDDMASSGHFRSLLLDSMGDEKSHMEGVAEYATRHARLCGLPSAFNTLVEILETAGRVHDLGKADPRFQAWLKGGNPWARGPLLAKSPEMAQSRTESRRARERAGYPKGGRHELLSVRLLESVPDALPQDPVLRDLLLHLVESHHGHCRPFAPVVEDREPTPVGVELAGRSYSASSATGLERLDSGPAERYWRLTRRYGWWGLAWLEALLRLADHRRSEWEEMRMKEAEQ